MEDNDRRAARVVCLDGQGRVLLMHWHDRVSGETSWEPPGGGLEPGETALDAARRELTEETGLSGSAVEDVWVEVRRDFRWLGVRYVKTEPFYLARFEESSPEVDPGELTPEESAAYLGYAWLESMPDRVEPPELAEVVAELTGRRRPARPPGR